MSTFRSRLLKPDMIRDDVLAEHPIRTQMLAIALTIIADRDGRLEDKPRVIRADLFPYRDDITSADVDADLSTLETLQRIRRYEAGGISVIELLDFSEHQSPHHTEKLSSLPSPSNEIATATDEAGEHTVKPPESSPNAHGEHTVNPPNVTIPIPCSDTDGCSDTKEAPPSRSPSSRGHRIPEDFALTDKMREYANNRNPNLDPELEYEKFVNHWRSKAGKDAIKTDWDATWRSWIIRADGYEKERTEKRDGQHGTGGNASERDRDVIASRRFRDEVRTQTAS